MAPVALGVVATAATVRGLVAAPSVLAAYAGLNAALILYALPALVGVGNALADVRAGWALRRPSPLALRAPGALRPGTARTTPVG